MTVHTEGRHAAEHIVSEASGTRSRAVGTLAAGNNLPAGAVLAVLNSEAGANEGKYTALNPTSAANPADGSKVAVAVLFAPVDATAADHAAVLNVRDCEVKAAALGWPSGTTPMQQTTALAELQAQGIVAR